MFQRPWKSWTSRPVITLDPRPAAFASTPLPGRTLGGTCAPAKCLLKTFLPHDTRVLRGKPSWMHLTNFMNFCPHLAPTMLWRLGFLTYKATRGSRSYLQNIYAGIVYVVSFEDRYRDHLLMLLSSLHRDSRSQTKCRTSEGSYPSSDVSPRKMG